MLPLNKNIVTLKLRAEKGLGTNILPLDPPEIFSLIRAC